MPSLYNDLQVFEWFIELSFNRIRNKTIRNYDTRPRYDFQLSRVRTNWGKQRFMYQRLVDWTFLSQDLRDTSMFSYF